MPGKEVYLNYALDQIPRILGNMDRNSFSPTYGCFHRDYWLDKTSDFPDAVRQFGSQACEPNCLTASGKSLVLSNQ